MDFNITTVDEAKAYLEKVVATFPEPWKTLALVVLMDNRFWKTPGSLRYHQFYEGGLAIHTAQVVQGLTGFLTMGNYPSLHLAQFAGIWHDYGKVRDYKQDDEGNWVSADFKFKVRHVAGSYGMLMGTVSTLHMGGLIYLPNEEEFLEVSHMMLAHHGRREWGSPVEPLTAGAWALHAADNMSARFGTGAGK